MEGKTIENQSKWLEQLDESVEIATTSKLKQLKRKKKEESKFQKSFYHV